MPDFSTLSRRQKTLKVDIPYRCSQGALLLLIDRTGINVEGDVDLKAKLVEWERFYNLSRPHGAHNGKTPYEALREKL